MRPVTCAVEGRTDEPVARKLLSVVGLSAGAVIVRHGKTKLDPKLPDYNRSAKHVPWLVIRDLDHDDKHACIPDLRLRLLGGAPSSGMCFRLAVREVEVWMMADRKSFANFFSVGLGTMTSSVEGLHDPKQTLVNLCRKSKKRDIREGMAPRPGSGRVVGPRYTSLLREFAHEPWDPAAARMNSQSLDRALRCLDRLRQWAEMGGSRGDALGATDSSRRELLKAVTEDDWAKVQGGFGDPALATE